MDFSKVEKKLADLFLGIEDNKHTVVIDVTGTYFTGDSLDSVPRKGKEGRIKKLVQIALVVTEKRGLPLMHRTYDGNVSNRFIMDDLVKDLWMNGYTVIVVDRGMSDPARIKPLIDLKFIMICGLRKTKDLKKITYIRLPGRSGGGNPTSPWIGQLAVLDLPLELFPSPFSILGSLCL
jgi:hypothetical protein